MGRITTTFINEVTDISIGSSTSGNYTTVRNGNNLFVGNEQDTAQSGVRHLFDGANYGINRFWFHFDTSSIPAYATIVSAFLRLPGTATASNNADSDTAVIVQSTVSSNDTIVTGDWTNLGSTSLGSIALASWNTGGNNDIALNASGLANITKAGHSKFALRTQRDIDAAQPTGLNNKTFSKTGLLLSVTYSIPDAGFLFNLI